MSTAYGLNVQPKDDPYISLAKGGLHALVTAAVPGTSLVDVLPFLQYFLRVLKKCGDIEPFLRKRSMLAAISSCILDLLEYPEALKKAQAEIDRVIKPGHLPDFGDEASLSYITAIVKEIMRRRDVISIAIPHYLEVEDEYKGYRLPACSIVILNAWYPGSFPVPFSVQAEV
ncbi:unnamed protein product [Cyclocybe aegerita]|uniref:Uncharacterized protein n=1 Tax=Cyclocybe aegerita TaxID=1973307 RepID=A0A8S0WG02_CYCAE|nr:unnamed protein product [Cyclocybe aegerita]